MNQGRNTSTHVWFAFTIVVLFGISCVSSAGNSYLLTNTPEFQVFLDPTSGCAANLIFEDPSDPTAMIVWCAVITSGSPQNLWHIRIIDGMPDKIESAPIWESGAVPAGLFAVERNGSIWTTVDDQVLRLTPNSDWSSLYSRTIVWNATTDIYDIQFMHATNDVYFMTMDYTNQHGTVWKLSNAVAPAAPISAFEQMCPTHSRLQVHQPSQQLFALCQNQSTVLAYSAASDTIRVYAAIPNNTVYGSFPVFLLSPDAAVVWIGCVSDQINPVSPLLIGVRENNNETQVTSLVTARDCLGDYDGTAISFHATSQVLYYACRNRLVALQMDIDYNVLSIRIVTNNRCLGALTPRQLTWAGRPLPLILPCTGTGQLLATAGNSVTTAIAPTDCASLYVISSSPNSLGQTVLLAGCANSPIVSINGVIQALSQFPSSNNGIFHVPYTNLIYSSCNFLNEQQRVYTELRVYNLRTQEMHILASCAQTTELTADFSSSLASPSLTVSNNATVIYSCRDSLWKLDLLPNGQQPYSLPVMLFNLTTASPSDEQGPYLQLVKVQAWNSKILFLYDDDSATGQLLSLDSNGYLYRIDDDECPANRFDLIPDLSLVTYDCDNFNESLPIVAMLKQFNLKTSQTTVLLEDMTGSTQHYTDTRVNGSHLTVAWNDTSFIVFDATASQITHAVPANCKDKIDIQPNLMLITNESAIFSCVSLLSEWSLYIAPTFSLTDPTITQPFVPYLIQGLEVCYGQPFGSIHAGTIDDTLIYLECKEKVLGFTTDFRCFPGQVWNSGSCSSCAAATFKPEAKFNASLATMDQCVSCPPGSVTRSVGSFTCITCELGLIPDSGNLTCLVCPRGEHTPFLGSRCVPCDGANQVGLECSNGLASVEEGYFAYLVEADCSGQSSNSCDPTIPIYHTAVCPRNLCPGGPLQLPTSNGGQSIERGFVDSIQYCGAPRVNSASNLLCGACDRSLGYIEWGLSCVECPGVDTAMVMAFLAFDVVVVVWLLLSSSTSGLKTTSGHVALLLYFVQTAMLQLNPVPNWIRFMHVVNLGTTSFNRCVAPISPIQQTELSLAMLLILLSILICIGFIQFACQKCCGEGDKSYDAAALEQLSSPFVFDAESAESGGNPGHNDHGRAVSNAALGMSDSLSTFAIRWGPLYRGYNSASARYWTSVVLVRRLVLAVVSIYLADPSKYVYRQVAFIFIHFASYRLHVEAQPYSSRTLNFVEGMSHSLLLTLGLLQAIAGSSAPPTWMQILVVSIVLLPTISLIVWIAKIQISNQRSKMRAFDPSGSVSVDGIDDISRSSFFARNWFRFRSSFDVNRYVAGAASILLFSYMGLVQTAFAFLRCVPVGDASIVFAAPTIDCHSSNYQHAAVGVIVILIAIGLGLPIAVYILLTRNNERITDEASIKN